MFVRETKDGRAKVSLRSKSSLNVAEICGKFGGGGHVKAAGCILDEDAESALKTIVDAIADELKKSGLTS